jgi:hypothetical protein
MDSGEVMPQPARPIGSDVSDLMTGTEAPAPAIGADVSDLMTERQPDFRVENEPPSPSMWEQAGTFAKEVGAQINPITAVRSLGEAIMSPIATTKQIGAAQEAVYRKAQSAYQQGDYVGAAAHFINYLLPLVGPSLDVAGEKMRQGDLAGGAGQSIAPARGKGSGPGRAGSPDERAGCGAVVCRGCGAE